MEEAKKFLESKGYVPDANGHFIVTGDNGHDFDLAELLEEYKGVSLKNTTPPVPPPPVKP